MMQTLIQALRNKFDVWPDSENFFTCDPDGEVRGGSSTYWDFYPSIGVDESDRSTDFGSMYGTVVTKEMFEFK